MKRIFLYFLLLPFYLFAQNIPLPEHPRPDFERAEWINLNGYWDFEFDSLQVGEKQNWPNGKAAFSKKILVPFPWGSPLSEIKDEADVAWYKKTISIPSNWQNKRPFLTIGASDWETTVWLDGILLGKHQGGYLPFSFDLTEYALPGTQHTLVVKVDDIRRDFTLYGKQGYGNARGIWQTPYLEARGQTYFEYLHFVPDIDQNKLTIKGKLGGDLSSENTLTFDIDEQQAVNLVVEKGKATFEKLVTLQNPTLWNLESPFLYNVTASVNNEILKTYFGYRKIGVHNLPGTEIPYVSLNNEPVYLQLTLDQSYHPTGFYTFPSDEFMKNEIQLCKNIGLNGLRTHIKVDIPRKLYWADKLGLFVMADLPNFWGEPGPEAQQESENGLRGMIERDFNHPAIFSWITFNETWGLRTKVKDETTGKEKQKYLPATQNWVASMYYLAKSLDGTRLVEDNSICCGAGHTETDINSWHLYLPGYGWEAEMKTISDSTFAGSTHHFEKGFTQGKQPMLNSECGNVWGYEGSTGDVDWSYDYHRMMNVFRMYPKMAGWLYTEHHDVINEWNGYWRFDRSMKYTGLNELVNGMTDRDLHSLVYLSTGQQITYKTKVGESVSVPLFVSSMSAENMGKVRLVYQISGIDERGNAITQAEKIMPVDYSPWIQKALPALEITMPENAGLYTLSLILQSENGQALHHNFVSFDVKGSTNKVIAVSPAAYTKAEWSVKAWPVMNGKKMNGAGKGYFEYELKGDAGQAKSAYVLMEIGAKELFVKDRDGATLANVDYMLGGLAEPSQNKNAYPMTDEKTHPSDVQISINGVPVKRLKLNDDPADHRGILSWNEQLQNNKLEEAGSYGYMVKIPLSKAQLKAFKTSGSLKLKIASLDGGGIAVYGREFGRYPFGVSLVLE